jgi:hypothetical protein
MVVIPGCRDVTANEGSISGVYMYQTRICSFRGRTARSAFRLYQNAGQAPPNGDSPFKFESKRPGTSRRMKPTDKLILLLESVLTANRRMRTKIRGILVDTEKSA